METPTLHLSSTNGLTVEELAGLYKRLTGKEHTREGLEHFKRAVDRLRESGKKSEADLEFDRNIAAADKLKIDFS